jgi:sugar lactone lactonase YvrE
MKNLKFCRTILSMYAIAVMLAGCGGSQLPIGAPGAMAQTSALATHAAPRWSAPKPGARSPRYEVTAPLLYAVNNENWSVEVYRARAKDPAPLATITDGLTLSFGDCIDDQGTLYVTNESSAGWVSEYPLGKTTPSKVITEGISEPAYCTIDANGNLWVANDGDHNVTEYLKGSKKPHTVISNYLVHPVGIAIDRSGNLYVGNGYGSLDQNVEVYAPGSKSPSRTITNGVTSPSGLAVDSNGALYVANTYQNNVSEYRSGQNDPFQTITEAMDRPGGVTVDKKGVLYVSNIANNTVVEFAPGSLKPLKREISQGLGEPTGVAYYPALLP